MFSVWFPEGALPLPKQKNQRKLKQSQSRRPPSNPSCCCVWPLPSWEFLVLRLRQVRHQPQRHRRHRPNCQWRNPERTCRWRQGGGSWDDVARFQSINWCFYWDFDILRRGKTWWAIGLEVQKTIWDQHGVSRSIFDTRLKHVKTVSWQCTRHECVCNYLRNLVGFNLPPPVVNPDFGDKLPEQVSHKVMYESFWLYIYIFH